MGNCNQSIASTNQNHANEGDTKPTNNSNHNNNNNNNANNNKSHIAITSLEPTHTAWSSDADRKAKDLIRAHNKDLQPTIAHTTRHLHGGMLTNRTIWVDTSLFSPERQYYIFVPDSCSSTTTTTTTTTTTLGNRKAENHNEGVGDLKHVINAKQANTMENIQPEVCEEKISEGFPLLCYFHGKCGWAEDSALRETKWIKKASKERFLVAFVQSQGSIPQGDPREKPDTLSNCIWEIDQVDSGDDIEYFTKVLVDIQEHFHVDRRRIYTCGFSNGGLWQSVIAVRFQDKVAACVNYMGGLSLSQDALDAEPHRTIRRMPMLVWTGSNDTMLPQCEHARDAFSACGHRVKYVCKDGWEHVWMDGIEEDMWTFLSEHTLSSTREDCDRKTV